MPIISTFAGGGVSTANGIPATSANIMPMSVAVDSVGNVYFSDGNKVRQVQISTGNVYTFAGGGVGGDGSLATSAELFDPRGIAFDAAGNLYVADFADRKIRKVTLSTGIISTVAGTGGQGFSGDGGPAVSAMLNQPNDVVVELSNGRLYIADWGNHCVRRVDTLGNITTVAGTGGVQGYSGDGGAAIDAQMSLPLALRFTWAGDLLVSDGNDVIRRISYNFPYNIITLIGSGNVGFSGDGGAALAADLYQPSGMALATYGAPDIYFCDSGNARIRKVDQTMWKISTVIGNGTTGFGGDGGIPTLASLNWPIGVATFGDILYIADWQNGRIRKVTPLPR